MSGRRPVRVVHVSQPVEAGVPAVVLALAADQRAAGWEVTVVSPPGPLADRARAAGLAWHPWPAGREPGPSVLRETRALRGVLRTLQPDLVHLHSSKAGLAGRLALRGRTPTVFTPHAWSFAAAGGLQRRAARLWERAAGRWTALLLCCSADELADGRALGLRGRALVVENGVDLERFAPPSEAERRRVRAALDLPERAPVAVCVGRLSRQKGQDVAVAAWPAVRRAQPDAVLLLVGDGPDAAALAGAAGPGVRLLGARDDVPALLGAADLAVLPSRWEGLALAQLEAMAVARPVVATAVGGAASTLLAGDLPPAGAVVPVEDPAALAGAVVARLADPAAASAEGRAGRQRVERDHDVRRTTARVRAACTALLEEGVSRRDG